MTGSRKTASRVRWSDLRDGVVDLSRLEEQRGWLGSQSDPDPRGPVPPDRRPPVTVLDFLPWHHEDEGGAVNEHATAPVETPADTVDDLVTIHLYPGDIRYRRSGSSEPQPGDIARCGWVKSNPHNPHIRPGEENCLMCIRLEEMAR